MIRRERIETKINHERWLISYADFITLLFAFFVVMYSVSQVNQSKVEALSETLSLAFSPNGASKADAPPPFQESLAQEDLVPALEFALTQVFREWFPEAALEMVGNEDWIELNLDANILFASGKASLSSEAQTLFTALAETLMQFDSEVSVAGHTDDVQISNSAFRSNWELSAARSIAVVNHLSQAGVAPRRLSATAYGEHRPVASNDEELGRQQNRRVVLRVSKPDERQNTVTESARVDQVDVEAGEQNPVSRDPNFIKPVKTRGGGLLFTSDPELPRKTTEILDESVK